MNTLQYLRTTTREASALQDELVKELKNLLMTLAAALAIMKIAYYAEGLGTILSTTLALSWLYVLPGYAMTFYWRNSFTFIERVAAGTVIAIAVTSILSYYLGISGLKIQSQTIILPGAIIAASLTACLKPWTRKKEPGQVTQTQPESKA